MARLPVLLVILLAIHSLALAQAKRRAVVVGVAGFEHGYASLEYTARDARRTAAALEDLGYSVSLLAADAEAGKVEYGDVLKALKAAAEKSQPGDTLLFFFAGHGSRRVGKDYLLLSDSDPDKFGTTALALDTLSEIVTGSKATRRVFVIDACRDTSQRADGKPGFTNGKLDSSFKDSLDKLTTKQEAGAGVQTAVLYACSPGETSKESVEERAGIFTQRFVQALQQTNDSTPITLGAVLTFVRAHMPPTLEQTPVLVGPDSLQIRPSPPGQASIRQEISARPPAGGGLTKSNPKDGAAMVWIPPGEFLMGDDDDAIKGFQNVAWTNPRHKVRLSGYYIYRDLVTVGQYEQFCTASNGKFVMPPAPGNNPNWSKKNYPIVAVTWDEASAYCLWAGVRLPTEAEWEKAARGTDGRKYPWGDVFNRSKCRCSVFGLGDSGGAGEVGRFNESPYGLSDMAGNVWQWCEDWFDADFWKSSATVQTDPVNESVGIKESRVTRGGSNYCVLPLYFRSSLRLPCPPAHVNHEWGFRCASSR